MTRAGAYAVRRKTSLRNETVSTFQYLKRWSCSFTNTNKWKLFRKNARPLPRRWTCAAEEVRTNEMKNRAHIAITWNCHNHQLYLLYRFRKSPSRPSYPPRPRHFEAQPNASPRRESHSLQPRKRAHIDVLSQLGHGRIESPCRVTHFPPGRTVVLVTHYRRLVTECRPPPPLPLATATKEKE